MELKHSFISNLKRFATIPGVDRCLPEGDVPRNCEGNFKFIIHLQFAGNRAINLVNVHLSFLSSHLTEVCGLSIELDQLESWESKMM